MLLKMAFLSALKRPKRAALIVLTVALSVFVMEFVSGWGQGISDRVRRKISDESAHILVEQKARLGALDPLEPKNFIANPAAVERQLLSDSRVTRVEEVIPFGGLVIAGDKNIPLKIYGIDPSTSFFSQISRGRVKGSFPFQGPGIAVSQKTLELLSATGAQSLIVLVEDAFGAPAYRQLPVSCVYQTDDSQFDASTAFVDRGTATELLGTTGAAELWLRLTSPDEATAVRKAFLPYLGGQGFIARTWSDLQGNMLIFIKFFDVFILVINIFVLIVAATVITNAILMNVFEKQREYATLRAIGMKRRAQGFLVLLEGAGQGALGALLGAAIAFPVILYFKKYGLPIGAASHEFGGGDVMYFGTNPLLTLQNMGFGLLIALLGSLYAAFVGTRSTVVDALKGI